MPNERVEVVRRSQRICSVESFRTERADRGFSRAASHVDASFGFDRTADKHREHVEAAAA